MEFNKRTLEKLREDMKHVLQEVEKTDSVLIELGSISYNDSQCEVKLKIYRNDGDVDGQKAEFERLAPAYGFKPGDYLRKFNYQGKTFQFCGFNRRARTNCCLFIQTDSQTKYQCTAEVMMRMLVCSENSGMPEKNTK